ncbi:hypothetical protein F53441_4229 [Fusarium austroafricanum]|uniref:Uncharacterized protein n=1 Tax=Fusarium austroafricanum TaxID=2364996 RepID=A0A8H4KPL7_9HYPO|nr:hypothetical protein F53441_4229 [Fusarium austroafricanum]
MSSSVRRQQLSTINDDTANALHDGAFMKSVMVSICPAGGHVTFDPILAANPFPTHTEQTPTNFAEAQAALHTPAMDPYVILQFQNLLNSMRLDGMLIANRIEELKRVTSNHSKLLHGEKVSLDQNIDRKRFGDLPKGAQFSQMSPKLDNTIKSLKAVMSQIKTIRKIRKKTRRLRIEASQQKGEPPSDSAISDVEALKQRGKKLEHFTQLIEKEKLAALYEASKLRQEFRKKKRAAAKEEIGNARKNLNAHLRGDGRSCDTGPSEKNKVHQACRDQSKKFEATQQSRDGASSASQLQDAAVTPQILRHEVGSMAKELEEREQKVFAKEQDLEAREKVLCAREQHIITSRIGNHESSTKSSKEREQSAFTRHMDRLETLAHRFPVVDDKNFDLKMMASFADHLGTDESSERFHDFLKSAYTNQWYRVQDVAEKGCDPDDWNCDICENREHQGVICTQVMVTTVNAAKRLRFKFDNAVRANKGSFMGRRWEIKKVQGC